MNAPDARAPGSAIDPRDAHAYLARRVTRTPMRRLVWLERLVGVPVWAKLESQQVTGSFKYRGAHYRLRNQPAGQTIIAASAGNHGLAVAAVARELGLTANICIPTTGSRLKRERILATGAGLIEHGSSLEDAIERALALAHARRWAFVSPYNDPDVIAGNATIAIEMLEQVPELCGFIAPVGGGGLIAGLALGALAIGQPMRIVGCEPERYQSFAKSLDAGRVVRVTPQPTLADGLAVNLEPGAISLDLAKPHVYRMLSLTEEELAAATLALLTHESLLVEPAGAAGIIACLELARRGELEGPVGIPLCGGNLHHTTLARIQQFPYRDDALLRLLDLRGRRAADMPVVQTHSSREPAGHPDAEPMADILGQLTACRDDGRRVSRDLDDFVDYCRERRLDTDPSIVEALRRYSEDVQRLAQLPADVAGDDALVMAEFRLRWARHLLAHIRRSLEWCSPSYSQSRTPQFFDLGAQDSPTLNYERYESPEVRRVEMQLLDVLSVDTRRFAVTATSSGMAAYTLIESFLLRERLTPGDVVMSAPYIYFEAAQQLASLKGFRFSTTRGYEVDEIVADVVAHRPRVLFVDPLTNTVEQRYCDVPRLLTRLRSERLGPITVVIDGTMLPALITGPDLDTDREVELIYYESCSKYLQLGMDASMAGLIVHSVETRPTFEILRRNTGTILYRHSAQLFPVFDRATFMRRMTRIADGARRIAEWCWNVAEIRDFIKVIYPALPDHPDRPTVDQVLHAGGCVTFSLRNPGANYRDRLEALIDTVIDRAAAAGLQLSKGVSFGFSIARISAASSMAENTPPFLRLYAGDLSTSHADRLAQVMVDAFLTLKSELTRPDPLLCVPFTGLDAFKRDLQATLAQASTAYRPAENRVGPEESGTNPAIALKVRASILCRTYDGDYHTDTFDIGRLAEQVRRGDEAVWFYGRDNEIERLRALLAGPSDAEPPDLDLFTVTVLSAEREFGAGYGELCRSGSQSADFAARTPIVHRTLGYIDGAEPWLRARYHTLTLVPRNRATRGRVRGGEAVHRLHARYVQSRFWGFAPWYVMQGGVLELLDHRESNRDPGDVLAGLRQAGTWCFTDPAEASFAEALCLQNFGVSPATRVIAGGPSRIASGRARLQLPLTATLEATNHGLVHIDPGGDRVAAEAIDQLNDTGVCCAVVAVPLEGETHVSTQRWLIDRGFRLASIVPPKSTWMELRGQRVELSLAATGLWNRPRPGLPIEPPHYLGQPSETSSEERIMRYLDEQLRFGAER